MLCVSAVAGVEVNTEKVWEYAAEIEAPVIVHLNKMDRERADLERALASLHGTFGRQVLPVQLPIGVEKDFTGVVDLVSGKAFLFDRDGNGKGREAPVPGELAAAVEEARTRLVEAVAESDEALLEKFFEEGTLDAERPAAHGLRAAIVARKIFPVTVGASGATWSGLRRCSTSSSTSRPRPSTAPTRPGGSTAPRWRWPPTRPRRSRPLVFKTLNDPFTGPALAGTRHLRDLWPTTPRSGTCAPRRSEKAHGLVAIQGKQGVGDAQGARRRPVRRFPSSARPTPATPSAPRTIPLYAGWIQIAEPAMSFAIEPKSKGDDEKIGEALNRLIEEDPSLRAGRDPQTHEFLLSGSGQLHVEITLARMKRRSNVEVILHAPKVPYRETILKSADGHGRHKKQTGGRGQFADCKIKIEPLERGADFEFVDDIFGGAIPQNFRPAVEKGIQEARQKGFLAGYPMVDFRVRLIDGQYHDVDSSELAFKIAGSLAYKDAMAKASPTLLEPVMKVEIHTSDEFMGDVMSDLSHRRGRPQGMDSKGGAQIVNALVPMAEMLNYAPALRSMTQGRSSFHMEFSHYEEVPRMVQEKIIAEARKNMKEEQEA